MTQEKTLARLQWEQAVQNDDFAQADKLFLKFIKLYSKIAILPLLSTLVILVLLQEGKAAGLGAISGAAETYWGKNKSRSMEGMFQKITKYLAIAFIILAIILNLNVF